jgi:hypothetical protein
METLGNIYENGSGHVSRRVKTYRDAQLGELVHSVVVEQLPENELVCGSEPAWEHEECEVVAEQQPPRDSGCEAATSSRGRRHGVAEASLSEKHQAPLSGALNVEVVLRHFHQCRYRSSPMWFFYWRGLWYLGR